MQVIKENGCLVELRDENIIKTLSVLQLVL